MQGNQDISEFYFDEAMQYIHLKQKYSNHTAGCAYLIDKIWLKNWKNFVKLISVKRILLLLEDYERNSGHTCTDCPEIEINTENHPGEISNKRLLYPLNEFLNDGDPQNPENWIVKREIDYRKNIKFIPKEMWDFLFTRYGGGPEIVGDEKFNYMQAKLVVEVYMPNYYVCFLPRKEKLLGNDELIVQISTSKPIYFSRRKVLSEFKAKLISIENYGNRNIKISNLRLWKLGSDHTLDEVIVNLIENFGQKTRVCCNQIQLDILTYLEYNDTKLENKNVDSSDVIIVEYGETSEDFIFEIKTIVYPQEVCPGCNYLQSLKFSCQCKEEWYCSERCMQDCFIAHSSKCKINGIEDLTYNPNLSKFGIVGLKNIGNTCFMNTSIQCISNCWEFVNYFLQNHYEKDINIQQNSLETKGVLAKTLANLLKNIWLGANDPVIPWKLKRAIAHFQPMFSDSEQQDAHEFLNYLLDGLNEDVNRVKNRPYIEIHDDDNLPENIKSQLEWNRFLQRNQSILVDLFYGQFKSVLTCLNDACQYKSTTFEPFLSISLPIRLYEIVCFFIFYDIGVKPIKLNLSFSSECSVMALRNKISKILSIPPFSFFIIKMTSTGDYDYFLNSKSPLVFTYSENYKEKNREPFFCMQINPEVFYNASKNKLYSRNKDLYPIRDFSTLRAELESKTDEHKNFFTGEYIEDESGAIEDTKDTYYQLKDDDRKDFGRILTDDNHGFSCDYLRVVVHVQSYDNDYSVAGRKKIIFPRTFYLNVNMTCEQIHKIIFNYFLPILTKNSGAISKDPWKTYFGVINTDLRNDSIEFHKRNNYPYRIRITNIMERYGAECLFCGESDCKGCLLPFNSTTIKTLIKEYPKNSSGRSIDNTFYYLSHHQKKSSSSCNHDFSLIVTWLQEDAFRVKNYLNDFVTHDFQVTQSAVSVPIRNCLKHFVEYEVVDWHCPLCKQDQKANKMIEVYKSPHILIVHLKRFKGLKKIECKVDFPINGFDISPCVSSNSQDLPLTYDLFAVANHSGGMGYGHYYSFASNPRLGQWYQFNDAIVSKINQKEIVTDAAYVLFYRRSNLENLIELEDIYKRSYVNYENQIIWLQSDLEAIDKIRKNDYY